MLGDDNMKNRKCSFKIFLLLLIFMLFISLTACRGKTGERGEQGTPGINGQDGKDGTSILSGSGSPSNTLGNNGDSYINLDIWDYYVKENNIWVLKGNIKGQDGQNGQDGINIVSTYINADGELIISLSNGSTVNVGKVLDTNIYTVNFYCGEDLIDTQIVKKGEAVSRPTTEMIEGYDVSYWYTDNDERWNFSGSVVTKDTDIYAHYTPKQYQYNFVDYGYSKTVASGEYSYYSTNLPVLSDSNAEFIGWRTEDNDAIIKAGEPSTIAKDTTLYSVWDINPTIDNGKVLSIDTANNKATYGLYPQTIIWNNPSLTSILDEIEIHGIKDSNGYYFYDGNYYMSKVAAEFISGSNYYLVNTETYQSYTPNQKYWYKCDKIEWNVIDNEGDVYTLISSSALDAQTYSNGVDNANHYEYSYIRTFINGEFYNRAFGYLNENKIIETTNSNKYESTTDKIYLLSEEEFKLYNPTNEPIYATNFSKMSGGWADSYYRTSVWLRTPCEDSIERTRKYANLQNYVGEWAEAIYAFLPVLRVSTAS